MSLSTQTQIRLPKIKNGLREGLNYTQIGASCKVTERTIDRDMESWVQSGLFEVWLKEEFVDLHGYARGKDRMEAYKQISKIVGRMVTRRIEKKIDKKITEEKTYTINMNLLSEDKRELLREAASVYFRSRKASSERRLTHTH